MKLWSSARNFPLLELLTKLLIFVTFFSTENKHFLQNHRIIKVGRDLCRTSGPAFPCSVRAAWSQLLRTISRWILSISEDGDATDSLGYLCQGSVHCDWHKKVQRSRMSLEPVCKYYFHIFIVAILRLHLCFRCMLRYTQLSKYLYCSC